ncbi:MAG: ATP-binding protein [Acidobacteriota bacterium]|nr:ATP-binding protein [Acidobacteriota bacterium]
MNAPNYRPRLANNHLTYLLDEFPAVMITGARAVGKTTTGSQHVNHIVRLDDPGVAAAFHADPDAALRRTTRPVLLDEWQEVPSVLGAVKRVVDRDPTPGQFILTGSVRAELNNEMWAGTGRSVRLSMYPLTERELRSEHRLNQPSFLERVIASGLDDVTLPTEVLDINGYIDAALRGGFPEIAYRERSHRARMTWLMSYVDDLVTRDAALLDAAKNPVKLRRYLSFLALSNAGLPSDATLYRAADVNAKTAAKYDQLLQNLYVLDLVPAWSSNRLSRLIKTAKRYIVDSSLAATAAGLSAEAILDNADLVGRYFDAFATAQLRAEIALTYPRPILHHLRTEAGRREIDLVIEIGGTRIVAFEFKAGVAPSLRDARHLHWLRDELGKDFVAGVILHSGPGIYELGNRVFAVPLCALWA